MTRSQLISQLLSLSPSTRSILELIQNRDSPSFGAPITPAELDTIPADRERLMHYIGATPFLIACDRRQTSICRAMLNHIPASELYLAQVWQFTTAFMMVCENKWKDIAETMLYENDPEDIHLFYVSEQEKKSALDYALRISGNQALLCSFFMHMTSPENPPPIYARAFQLITDHALVLDRVIPKSLYVHGESTLFTQVVLTYAWENITTVLSDILNISADHLDLIPSDADTVWSKLVMVTTPAFIQTLVELPVMQRRLQRDKRLFSNLFGHMVENGWVEESMYMIQFASTHQVPSFVLETVLSTDPSTSILSLVEEVVEEQDNMRPVLNAVRELNQLRAQARTQKSRQYYTTMLSGIDKSRKRAFARRKDTKHPYLPYDMDYSIAAFAASDDGRPSNAPLYFKSKGRGPSRRNKCFPKGAGKKTRKRAENK